MKKIITIFVLIFLMTIVSVFAEGITSITLTAPSDNAWIKGTYNFQATYIGNTSGNVTFFANSTTLCSDTSVGTVNGTASCSKDTSSLTDGTYIIYARAYNSTGSETANDTSTSVKIDNTDPSISSFTIDEEIVKKFGRLTYTCSASDNMGTLTYSVVLTKPDGSTSTKTSSSDTFELDDLNIKGLYTIVCTVTDQAGNSDTSSTLDVWVKSDDEGRTVVTVSESTKKFGGLMWIVTIVILTGFVILAYWYMESSSPKRRKRR